MTGQAAPPNNGKHGCPPRVALWAWGFKPCAGRTHQPEKSTMPKKRITTNVTVAVSAEGEAGYGAPVAFYAPPGTEIVLEASEADRIMARWGGEVLEVIPDEEPAGK